MTWDPKNNTGAPACRKPTLAAERWTDDCINAQNEKQYCRAQLRYLAEFSKLGETRSPKRFRKTMAHFKDRLYAKLYAKD